MRLEGKVYLTVNVDGLDPSIIPSTGTPQPGGLSCGGKQWTSSACWPASRNAN